MKGNKLILVAAGVGLFYLLSRKNAAGQVNRVDVSIQKQSLANSANVPPTGGQQAATANQILQYANQTNNPTAAIANLYSNSYSQAQTAQVAIAQAVNNGAQNTVSAASLGYPQGYTFYQNGVLTVAI